jgi:sucrose synthase
MTSLIEAVVKSEEKIALLQFINELRDSENRYLLRNDILSAFEGFCTQEQQSSQLHSSRLAKLIYYTQEIILEQEGVCLVYRPKIARQEACRVRDDMTVEPLTTQELLDVRDRFVNHFHPEEGKVLEIDFGPFYDYSPVIRDPKNIGRGVQYLNRYLSSKLFQDPRQWLEALFNFLSLHSYNGITLLINGRIENQHQLSEQVKEALIFLSQYSDNSPYEEFRFEFQSMGFEAGWGNTAARIGETLSMLDELIDSPDDQVLEPFLSRIPMIFRIVLVSVHGWFGQEGVLGRPDTGGKSSMC